MKEIKNVPASVFNRLKEKARSNKEDLSLLLMRYGMERMLYRLSTSKFASKFVLKGASLFLVWTGQNYRVTKDADLLGFGNPDANRLKAIFNELCELNTESIDGIVFQKSSLKVESIREGQEYDGIRITLRGLLGSANIPLQIDIGFGDVVIPKQETVQYPTLLNGPAPVLKAYPKYTVIAEKFEAMVKLGIANSRMKDFYDVYLLSCLFDFECVILKDAIINTFKRRNTLLPEDVPFAFTSDFFDDAQKKIQWKAFLKKSKAQLAKEDLSSIVGGLEKFLMPVIKNYPGKSWQKMWKSDARTWKSS